MLRKHNTLTFLLNRLRLYFPMSYEQFKGKWFWGGQFFFALKMKQKLVFFLSSIYSCFWCLIVFRLQPHCSYKIHSYKNQVFILPSLVQKRLSQAIAIGLFLSPSFAEIWVLFDKKVQADFPLIFNLKLFCLIDSCHVSYGVITKIYVTKVQVRYHFL